MESNINTTEGDNESRSVSMPNATCNCIVESLFKQSFGSRSYAEKDNIIKNKKPTPQLNITSKTKTFLRHFKNTVYTDVSWICGCANFQKFFCWPCLLFSVEVNVWTKDGFSDLNNLSKATKRHECCQNHINSCVKLRQFGNQNRIEFHLSDQFKANIEKYNKTVTANRYIVSKLIDVICFLSKQELAFRGHSETLGSDNRGNYIEPLYLLSTSDPQLKMHLEQPKVFTGLSNRIQNDIIESVANIILEEIKSEINRARFVSIIVDETTDICHKSQLSTIFRYVTGTGNIEERFVGFTDVSENRDAAALFNHIVRYLDEYNCRQKLIAQTYDGAAVMAGEHNGVQAKVKHICSSAIFVHCYAHRLNLVFSQSVNFIKECKVFFQSLTGFASFFSKSTKRSYALDQEIKKRFPAVAPTRWNYNSRVLNTVMEYKAELKSLLLDIIENSEQWDSDTTTSARGLYLYLIDFDFNLVWNNLKTDEELSEVHPRKRLRIDNVGERETSYRRLFLEIIGTLIRNTKDRFADIKTLLFMSLLDVSKFKAYAKKFPENVLDALKQFYGTFFDFPKLKSELIYVYSSPEFADKTIIYIKNYILKDDLIDVFKEVYTLITLILTIPATSASAERSFSTLKRIKTYSRNSQNEERLSSLASISIEKQLLISLKEYSTFDDRVIDDFSKKERRIELHYKK